MPSLNLRGVESKIVLIFVREKKVTGIPGYTGRIPPKNFLGFSENLKLVHHLPEIR